MVVTILLSLCCLHNLCAKSLQSRQVLKPSSEAPVSFNDSKKRPKTTQISAVNKKEFETTRLGKDLRIDKLESEKQPEKPEAAFDGIWGGNAASYCVSRDLNTPEECTFCIYSYLGKDNKCRIPNRYIQGCLVYENNETCEICQKGNYLSTNKKICAPCGIAGCAYCKSKSKWDWLRESEFEGRRWPEERILKTEADKNDKNDNNNNNNNKNNNDNDNDNNMTMGKEKVRFDIFDPREWLKKKIICDACFKDEVPLEGGGSCGPDPDSREPTAFCLVHNPETWECEECEISYILNLDGFGNHCVREDLRNNFCLVEQNLHCLQCQNTAYMDVRLECHTRERKMVLVAGIILGVLVFLLVLVYVFFFSKCRKGKARAEMDQYSEDGSQRVISIM